MLLDCGGVEGPISSELMRSITTLSPNETELARLTGGTLGSVVRNANTPQTPSGRLYISRARPAQAMCNAIGLHKVLLHFGKTFCIAPGHRMLMIQC